MEYKIEISAEIKEDIVVFAKEKTALLTKIEELLRDSDDGIYGYSGNDIVKLDKNTICAFFVEAGKVYAETEAEKLLVKDRLYVYEEKYPKDFVKINQSCLINIAMIERFRTTLGGALEVRLKNGYRDYVSRRQLKEVKERLGI